MERLDILYRDVHLEMLKTYLWQRAVINSSTSLQMRIERVVFFIYGKYSISPACSSPTIVCFDSSIVLIVSICMSPSLQEKLVL